MAKKETSGGRRQPRLGRGLSSLMSRPVEVQPPAADVSPIDAELAVAAAAKTAAEAASIVSAAKAESGDRIVYLMTNQIAPNPRQPRRVFNESSLKELAASIKSAGVMQPVIVRKPSDGGTHELVAGERRWRAAKIAELEHLPAIVKELNDGQVAEWSLIENLQREDLNPIEKALAFRGLIEQFKLSHEDVGHRVGIDRSTITNSLRLLTLDEEVQDLVRQSLLSVGQAKVLLGVLDVQQQRLLARRAITNDWPVRRIEQEVREKGGPDLQPEQKKTKVRASHLADLERQISEQLGTKARVKPGRKKGAGTLSIEFYSLDQFDALLERLGVESQ